MKIAILTFWETTDNYGQVLQGYALQTYLRSLGHSAFVIRYDHDGKFRKGKVTRNRIKKIVKLITVYPVIQYLLCRKEQKALKKRLKYNQSRNVQRNFDEFRRRYYEYSPVLYHSLRELQDNSPTADIYIVGSDQVWGWSLEKYDNRVFFLDFGSDTMKRVAYAPSFAMEKYFEKYKPELHELLEKFNAISVRERTGVDICKSVGFDAEWVCDPTMLLESKDYMHFLSKKQEAASLFMYSINIEKKEDIFWDEIQAIASNNGLKIIVTTSSGHIPANELFEGVFYDYSTVEGWLSNIFNSKFVVTTSFHGVSLCILLNKEFAFVPLSGKYAKGNNRVTDLLKLLELENHIVNNENPICSIFCRTTDWENTNKLMNEFRKKSQTFLISNLVEK